MTNESNLGKQGDKKESNENDIMLIHLTDSLMMLPNCLKIADMS